jgi:hypothetical protein
MSTTRLSYSSLSLLHRTSSFEREHRKKVEISSSSSFLYFSGYKGKEVVLKQERPNLWQYLRLRKEKIVEEWSGYLAWLNKARIPTGIGKFVIGSKILEEDKKRRANNRQFVEVFKNGQLNEDSLASFLKKTNNRLELTFDKDPDGKNMIHKACELGDLNFFNVLYESARNRGTDWRKAVGQLDNTEKSAVYYAILMLADRCNKLDKATFKNVLEGFMNPLIKDHVYYLDEEEKDEIKRITNNCFRNRSNPDFLENVTLLLATVQKTVDQDRAWEIIERNNAAKIKTKEQLFETISKTLDNSKTEAKVELRDYFDLMKSWKISPEQFMNKKGMQSLLKDPEKLDIFLKTFGSNLDLSHICEQKDVENHSLLDNLILTASTRSAPVNEKLIDLMLSLLHNKDIYLPVWEMAFKAVELAHEKKQPAMVTYINHYLMNMKKSTKSLSILEQENPPG